MDSALAAYDEAWNNTPKEERNDLCERMADDYIAAHPEMRTKYGALTVPQLVALIDLARAAGDEEERIRIDIWINGEFEYQTITGGDGVYQRESDLPKINVHGDRRVAGGA